MCYLPFLWFVSNLLLDWFRNMRVKPIIRPGKSDIASDIMGVGSSVLVQSSIRDGTSIMATPLLT